MNDHRCTRILFFFILLSHSFLIKAQQAPNVWDVLRQKFSLNHEASRAEVQDQIRWLVAHPNYLQTACRQSEPYIYHIVSEIMQRNLPGELALLPMIESAYNPFAYSDKGAAGLWQLMPKTGWELGLKQDWWFDGRRGIRSSTDAALNYLLYLNKLFKGNWIYAIAAYDAGGGTVSRAIKLFQEAGRALYFWNLILPRETQIYVPRFLALAEIIQNPERYKIALPSIPYMPYFEEVNIGSQINLNRAAKLAGISYKALIKLNPGYNRWTTPPYEPFRLLIPKDRARIFSMNLFNTPQDNRVSWIKHVVVLGDNLANIANRYHTTINLIKQLNQLKTNELQPRQMILIPSSLHSPMPEMIQQSSPLKPRIIESKHTRLIHIVQPHETYEQLERMYKVSRKEIQLWNQLHNAQPLSPGQQLVIWRNELKSSQYG